MTKKRFKAVILLVVVVASCVFMSCGSRTKGVTLVYSIWDKNQEPGMRAIADAFEKNNPEIKIKIEVTPWNEYWTKLEAAAQANSLPDVFWMHIAHFLKYAGNKKLMEIGSKVNGDNDVDFKNYPEGLVKLYEYDGKNYALPKDFDTIGLWYNKTLFDKAGLKYPDETWDWNTFLAAAQKLTDSKNGIWGFPAKHSAQEGYHNFIYQNEGYVISKDRKKSGYSDPNTIGAIQFYSDLINKYKVSPSLAQLADMDQLQQFESGKAGMALFGSWMVSYFVQQDYIKANCDVAVLPKGKKRATIYNGLGNVIAANSPNKEAAWKFLKFLGSEEANLIQAEYGSAIPAYNGTQEPWFMSFKNKVPFNLKTYADQLEDGVIYPFSKSSAKWYEDENVSLREAFSKQGDVTDSCLKQAGLMQALLDKE